MNSTFLFSCVDPIRCSVIPIRPFQSYKIVGKGCEALSKDLIFTKKFFLKFYLSCNWGGCPPRIVSIHRYPSKLKYSTVIVSAMQDFLTRCKITPEVSRYVIKGINRPSIQRNRVDEYWIFVCTSFNCYVCTRVNVEMVCIYSRLDIQDIRISNCVKERLNGSPNILWIP